jgi:hypothetical protein
MDVTANGVSEASVATVAPAPTTRRPALVERIAGDALLFRPAPPGDATADGHARLKLPRVAIDVDVSQHQMQVVVDCIAAGALEAQEVDSALTFAGASPGVRAEIGTPPEPTTDDANWEHEIQISHQLDRLALIAIELVDRAQHSLLATEPLSEVHVTFSGWAKAALVLGWEAIAKKGAFPIPPRGKARFEALNKLPHGALHFVSASDLDAGYLYTMGIAQSPEAQALQTMDLTYGLDGELIVPGQAVSPIPPFLALATRLFAASIPTSSNISEEVQSIPMRNFPHPTAIDDIEPRRGGRLKPPTRPRNADEAITDLRLQISRFDQEQERKRRAQWPTDRLEGTAASAAPEVAAAYEVTGMGRREIVQSLTTVLADPALAERKQWIALYLNVEPQGSDRVDAICAVVDAANELGLKYVAVADDVEDSWLPNLLEYLEPDELNAVADYSDPAGVIVIDGRPVDPVYTAATAAQRIQSVFSTLSVDILKMGMWLCLDALAARKVWKEIVSNPHIPRRMVLMPIGIVEPWDAFVDNRDPTRTPRAILDPFEKIKFMIEEAAAMGMPSLLTDTRHKSTWVLLGRKTPGDQPHVREHFDTDPRTGQPLGRTSDSAIPLLSWDDFMQCERIARAAGILLGQAGSIEVEQAFRVLSGTTYDAAKAGRNPATAIWTAETERVLRVAGSADGADLQTERSSDVAPFLAVVNRGFESHAKLDGWLRYLADIGRGDSALRQDLENRRAELMDLIGECLAAQRHDPSRYQRRWDAYRTAYLAYHDLIKTNFVRIRHEVATAWSDQPAAAGA